MDEKQLQALTNELAKNLKTPDDFSQFDRLLKKNSVEASLNAEMSHHLVYDKNQPKSGANSRNSLRFVSWKDYKAVTRDLKAIYQAPTEEAGQQAPEAFAAAWDSRYP